MPWTFLDFVDTRGQNVIKTWLDTLPVKAKAKINARLLHLQREEQWVPPYVKMITGYRDIYEIRVIRQSIEYRPLGFYGTAQGRIHPRDRRNRARQSHLAARCIRDGRWSVRRRQIGSECNL